MINANRPLAAGVNFADNYGAFGNEPGAAVTGQPFQSSVYSVELERPPSPQTRPGAMAAIPYVVQIAKTQATGAVVRNCVFEDSSGFFARCGDSPIFLTKLSTRGLNCLRPPSTLHANVLVPVIVSQCLSLSPSLSLSLCVCLCVVHTHARACTHAHCLVWCRWKSSHAIMENCSFRGNGYPIIEMQVLPSFFESPPHIRNVTVRSNSFGVGDADTSFQHNNKIPRPNKHGAWQKGWRYWPSHQTWCGASHVT